MRTSFRSILAFWVIACSFIVGCASRAPFAHWLRPADKTPDPAQQYAEEAAANNTYSERVIQESLAKETDASLVSTQARDRSSSKTCTSGCCK